MEIDYRAYLDEEGILFLRGLRRTDQNKILREIGNLKTNPFREPEFNYQDTKGRKNSGIIVGIYCLIYWVDHGEKVPRHLADMTDAYSDRTN